MNNSPIGISKVLNSINTTLNIANKAIPLYNQAKPIVSTITKTYKTIKTNRKEIPQLIKLIKVKNQIKKDMNNNISIPNNELKQSNIQYNKINNPTFFI